MSKRMRLAWASTAIVALLLLVATVALAARERSLPAVATTATVAESASSAGEVQPDDGPAAASRPGEAANGLIAFVADRDGNDEIYTMRPDGSDQTRLTDDPGRDSNPLWAPDGNRLFWARVEDSDGNGHFGDRADLLTIMSARPDGTDQRALFSGELWVQSAGGNADFSRFALFVIDDSNENNEIDEEDGRGLVLLDLTQPDPVPVDLLADLDEGVTVSDNQANFQVQWLPADEAVLPALVVDGKEGLYALPLAGGEPQLVVEGTILDAAVAPDGSRVAVWKQFEDTGRQLTRLILHDLESGQETPMLMAGLNLRYISNLQWSGDVTRLIFLGSSGFAAPRIYSLDIASGEVTSLSQHVSDPAFSPAVAPDGRWTLLVAQPYRRSSQGFVPAGDADIYRIDELGSTATRLTQEQGNNSSPAWQPVFP